MSNIGLNLVDRADNCNKFMTSSQVMTGESSNFNKLRHDLGYRRPRDPAGRLRGRPGPGV
jgi:hypothetical protein